MKSLLIILVTAIFCITFSVTKNTQTNFVNSINQPDTSEFDQEKALQALREQIIGKEEMPASEVFENIKIFNRLPAGRLLRIMEFGYSRSLGVTCIHCHNPEKWSSDEKEEKLITREMSEMVNTINNELLANIQELGGRNAVVNCTTCHKGQKKPALSMQ